MNTAVRTSLNEFLCEQDKDTSLCGHIDKLKASLVEYYIPRF